MCYTVTKHSQDIKEHSRNVKKHESRASVCYRCFSVIAPKALEGLAKCRQTVFHCAVDYFKSRFNGFFKRAFSD